MKSFTYTRKETLSTRIDDEKTGLTYTLHGDYYFPEIDVPDREYRFNRFGRMYFDHLKEHKPALFTTMLLDGTLYDHVQMIDCQAQERFDTLMAGYIRSWGITEDLKADDQMKWVGLMNQARVVAEHNIVTELILN